VSDLTGLIQTNLTHFVLETDITVITTCIKIKWFNQNCRAIFERKKLPDGKKGTFVTLALGSRDRSISVWSTDLQRPYFVVYDLFEQAVVDLSWSKDGRVLLAW
jgi:protein HIRA/HIR1